MTRYLKYFNKRLLVIVLVIIFCINFLGANAVVNAADYSGSHLGFPEEEEEKENTPVEEKIFEAIVQKNSIRTVLVLGTSKDKDYFMKKIDLVISEITVCVKNGTQIKVEDIALGDKVRINHFGMTSYTEPMRITNVAKIEVISDSASDKTTESSTDTNSNVTTESTTDSSSQSSSQNSKQKVKAPSKAILKSLKNNKGKKLVIKWKKNKDAKGYQIQYALNSKFSKNRKVKSIKGNSNKSLTCTVKNLKKNKVYFVRVRAYTLDSNGKKIYGKWSSVKKIKIKQ